MAALDSSLWSIGISSRGSCIKVTPISSPVEALHEVTDVVAAVPWRSGWAQFLPARRLVVATAGGRRVEPVVYRGKGRQAECSLDEFQDRAVFVQRRLQVALLRKGGDHPRRHPETEAVGVELRRRDVVEIPRLVVGDDVDGDSSTTSVSTCADRPAAQPLAAEIYVALTPQSTET